MRQVNLYEAKTQLSKLVEAAIAGEEVIIAHTGKQVPRCSELINPVTHRECVSPAGS